MTDLPTSPYSQRAAEALVRLGINVHAPVANQRWACELLLPFAAVDGYYAMMRNVLSAGQARPGDDDSQLDWLASHLQLVRPRSDCLSRSWREDWLAAEQESQLNADSLPASACRVLLDELLALPEYRRRRSDALANAMRFCVGQPRVAY